MRSHLTVAGMIATGLALHGCGGDSASDSKRVFVTSLQSGASFGGLAQGDARCTTAAGAANLTGTWKAWLSDSTGNAVDRIADVGPWVLIDGTKVFNNKLNLQTSPIVGIDQDEQGVLVTHLDCVWTGTEPGGATTSMGSCMDWTSTDSRYATAAKVGSTGANWTKEQINPFPCYSMCHLYCFEQ